MSIWCFVFLFGVLLINGQCHYLVFYIWPHIWAGAVLVLHIICPDIQVHYTSCFINVTILFGVMAILDKVLGVFGN